MLSGTATFAAFEISANQFLGYASTTAFINVAGIAAAHITDVNIAGNRMQQVGGTLTAGINLAYCDRVNLSGNQIQDGSGAGTGVTASNCTKVNLDPHSNQITGCATAYSLGSNANLGTFTLVASAATVANTSVTGSSKIAWTLKTAGGTVAPLYVATITPGTGFTVAGTGVLDTSTYNYEVTG